MSAKPSSFLGALARRLGLAKPETPQAMQTPPAGEARSSRVLPVTAEQQAAIDGNLALVQGEFSRDVGIVFDLARPSLEWLDGFVSRTRNDTDNGSLPQIVGTYLGECIRHRDGGRWIRDPDGNVGLEIEPNFTAFPFAKAGKQYAGGEGDSILGLYDSLPSLLARHRNGTLGRA